MIEYGPLLKSSKFSVTDPWRRKSIWAKVVMILLGLANFGNLAIAVADMWGKEELLSQIVKQLLSLRPLKF